MIALAKFPAPKTSHRGRRTREQSADQLLAAIVRELSKRIPVSDGESASPNASSSSVERWKDKDSIYLEIHWNNPFPTDVDLNVNGDRIFIRVGV